MLKRVLPVVAGLIVALPAGFAQGSDLPGAPQRQTQTVPEESSPAPQAPIEAPGSQAVPAKEPAPAQTAQGHLGLERLLSGVFGIVQDIVSRVDPNADPGAGANQGSASGTALSSAAVRVKAPFVEVSSGSQLKVRAPFVKVDRDKDGALSVKAPFVSVEN
ncbi:MAG: hypothetical protein SFV17_10545 [Candidatus Obscuribacter sp.]|nr:hypothetical protein [Candidatus Melainabacteria bacterium]MDX1987111.1 hypothetical protein [Candidatus Obscuribacter sp.]